MSPLDNSLWKSHKIGDQYSMKNADGSDGGVWKIAYYYLTGTYKVGNWVELGEPRALIERNISGGIDFREMPLRYLNRI